MRRLVMALALTVSMLAAAAALPPAVAGMGNETTNFTYDELGRLNNVSHSGSVNGNIQSSYQYDKAGNRLVVNVTGAPN